MTNLPRQIPRAALAAALLSAAGAAAATGAAGSPATEQVVRGTQFYEGNCAVCHGHGFAGGPGVPGLTGASFQFGWKDRPATDLFRLIKTTMPPGQEGSLSDQQVVDVMAAVLSANKASVTSDPALPADEGALKDKTIRFGSEG